MAPRTNGRKRKTDDLHQEEPEEATRLQAIAEDNEEAQSEPEAEGEPEPRPKPKRARGAKKAADAGAARRTTRHNGNSKA